MPQQPKKQEVRKPLRQHEVIKAEAWDQITDKYRRSSEAQRKELNKKFRYEVSVEDLRDEIIGIVHERFGRDESAFHEVQALGGAHWRTLRNWELGDVKRPQMAKLREVALTCGYDLRLVRRD